MEAIKGILLDGFRVNYHFEYLPQFYSYKSGEDMFGFVTKPGYSNPGDAGFNLFILYIPMVSFCDIPISNIQNHLINYSPKGESGNKGYAIGLTKKWGIRSGLNQIIYVIQGSTVAQNFSNRCLRNAKFYEENEKNRTKTGYYGYEKYSSPVPFELKNGLINDNKGNLYPYESLFLKPLGEIKYDSPTGPKIKNSFIDEKEWRYVPNSANLISSFQFNHFSKNADYYESILRNADKALKEAPKYDNLRFEIDDITHIVVGYDSEIPELQDHLNRVFKSSPHDKLMLLHSKVTSYETLQRDFFSN